MARKRKSGVCVYCGRYARLSSDHIPPKGIFGKPRPNNLVTVPSCRGCNQAASKDDEYFQLMLSARYDSGEHPDAEQASSAVLRGLRKRQKAGFRRAVLGAVEDVDVFTPAGIYAGRHGILNVDLDRLGRVAERVIKGLYYHHSGRVLEDTYKARAWELSGFGDNATAWSYLDKFTSALLDSEPNVIGEQTFAYRFLMLDENPCFSAWLLTFYGVVNFFGITTVKEQVGEELKADQVAD